MPFILGKKIAMTQIFRDDKVIPVTKIIAGPCFVTQIKTKNKDGYNAIQIGFGKKKSKKKSIIGQFKHLKDSILPKGKIFAYLKEFIISEEDLKKYKVGDEITVSSFKPGEKVVVSGLSKGKGFQGVVKRHGFHGQSASHGNKDQLRMPGSIGSTGPARVFKGMRMPGRMGGNRITIKNLEIIEVKPDENLLFVKGAVPGARNSIIEIKK